MSSKNLNAVGANIFAGGFTVGVAKHFNILAHLEHDDYGVEVTKANFKQLPVVVGRDAWPEKANKPIHFLYSNPPCAIWSLAGNKHGRIDWRQDPRLQRVRDIFSLVERYRPQVWCWESVCQAFEKGRPFVEEIADAAAKLGYSASYVLIDAMYMCAPMTRKRFFLVLHRVAIDWEKARPDFDAPPVLPRDVLKQVKKPTVPMRGWGFAKTDIGKQMERVLKATPPGGRLGRTFEDLVEAGKLQTAKTERGTMRGKPSFLAYRIDPDKVCGVLFGDKTFHPTEQRHLALNELGVLHGFPEAYDWVNDKHRLDIQRGVLPPVGEWLARNVAAAIRANRAVRKPARTLVDFRRAPGPIQEVLALPADVDLNWKPDRLARTAAATASEPVDRPRKRSSTTRAATGTGFGPSGVATSKKPNQIKNLPSKPRNGVPEAGKKPRVIKDIGDYKAVLSGLGRGIVPATSGALIRARILEGRLDADAIAAEVRERWPGRTTSKSDVAWNRNQLKKAGVIA